MRGNPNHSFFSLKHTKKNVQKHHAFNLNTYDEVLVTSIEKSKDVLGKFTSTLTLGIKEKEWAKIADSAPTVSGIHCVKAIKQKLYACTVSKTTMSYC